MNIINMQSIEQREVKWLWYPYLPRGKVTLAQGDPGDGKTTLVLAIAALLTRGQRMPRETTEQVAQNVIYQTAEDGLADTIKPRLVALGADCSRVSAVGESETGEHERLGLMGK